MCDGGGGVKAIGAEGPRAVGRVQLPRTLVNKDGGREAGAAEQFDEGPDDAAAKRAAQDGGAGESEEIEDGEEIGGEARDVEAVGGFRGVAVAAEVEADYVECCGESVEVAGEEFGGARPAVDEDKGRARAFGLVEKRDAVVSWNEASGRRW